MDYYRWLESLEKFKVLVYRRPDFLSDAFEYESYMGTKQLRNLFKDQVVDTETESIFLSFPERWLNCVECHQLYPRLQEFYPSLKKLQIKTHSPLIISCTPNGYAYTLKSEDEIVEETRRAGNLDKPTSVEDTKAIFDGISKGKLFVLSNE